MSHRKAAGQSRYSGKRRLMLEQLERRNLMAGFVNAFVSGGSLFINGDGSDNVIQVAEVDDEDGNSKTRAYAVAGADTTITFGKGGSRVDEDDLPPGASSAAVFINVKFDIHVNMKGGSDVVGIGNSTQELIDLAAAAFPDLPFELPSGGVEGDAQMVVPRNLLIDMGDGRNAFEGVVVDADIAGTNQGGIAKIVTGLGGNAFSTDFIAVGGSRVGGTQSRDRGADLLILTGNGDDSVSVTDFFVADLLQVSTGNGNDEVDINQAGDGDAELRSRAKLALILTGNGEDIVTMNNFALSNGLTVNTSGGDRFNDEDSVSVRDFQIGSLLLITTGLDNDEVFVGGLGLDDGEVPASSTKDLTVDTGAGEDLASVFDMLILRNATVRLGSGNDSLAVDSINNDGSSNKGLIALIDAGDGDDVVSVFDTHFDARNSSATVLMGAGEFDRLSVSLNANSAKRTVLSGGKGKNDLISNEEGLGNGKYKQGNAELIIKEFEETDILLP